MNVLIFSGGTGSIALQTGFSHYYNNMLNVQVLTNAYDNGKSTGAVRQVYDGKILGPSDVRKNQTTQYRLRRAGDEKDAILQFLEDRFDIETSKAQQYCLNKIFELADTPVGMQHLSHTQLDILESGIRHFFNQPKAHQISYNDFSLSNIIYAGIAAQNNYSLGAAGKIMADILMLPEDSVILNDDTSLFLRAVTEHGRHILDEGEIVDWNNPSDKIKRIYFVGHDGQPAHPVLSQQSIDAINNADIIIFSSGTQWSSLIPTYVSSGPAFRGIIERSKAQKYIVINNEQDKDMKGCDVNYMLEVLYDFLPLDNITKIFNTNASAEMTMDKIVNKVKCFEYELSTKNKRTHHPRVAPAIMSAHYSKYLKNKKIVFDYDDTLVGRNNEFKHESDFNVSTLCKLSAPALNRTGFIFTGNYIKAIHINADIDHGNPFKRWSHLPYLRFPTSNDNLDFYPFYVYADGGVNLYRMDKLTEEGAQCNSVECINDKAVFTNEEVDHIVGIIQSQGIHSSKIQNRNNATISIKPIDNEYRKPICLLLEYSLAKEKLFIRPCGRTTIDISKILNNKDLAFNHLKAQLKADERITYVGDESHEGGNDYIMLQNNIVDYLHVNNPRDTTMFLLTLKHTNELLMALEQ